MTSAPFTTGLSMAETERLALLIEECGEVIQAASKVLRHGWDLTNPLQKQFGPSNRESLAKEMGHVWNAMNMMLDEKDVRTDIIHTELRHKRVIINRWLHFNTVKP